MSSTRRIRLGLILWAVQPLYLVVEAVAAALARAPYSLLHNTISDLGATTCTEIPYPAQDVAVCSPAHAAVNASFVVFGLTVALGSVLLHPALPRRRSASAAIWCWVLAGLSTVGAGLTPVDRALDLHALVSMPGIVVTGLATMFSGIALTDRRKRWHWLTAMGVVAAVSGAVMLVRLEVDWGGLLERVAVWPAALVPALVAAALWRAPREPGGR